MTLQASILVAGCHRTTDPREAASKSEEAGGPVAHVVHRDTGAPRADRASPGSQTIGSIHRLDLINMINTVRMIGMIEEVDMIERFATKPSGADERSPARAS